jgi:hypothetical protein
VFRINAVYVEELSMVRHARLPLLVLLVVILSWLTPVAARWMRTPEGTVDYALLKGDWILDVGSISYNSEVVYGVRTLSGQTVEWYEFLPDPTATKQCFTFLTPRPRLTESLSALLLMDQQRVMKVAVFKTGTVDITVDIEPVQLVRCPR